jgi:soluble lytic murein transglycosylase
MQYTKIFNRGICKTAIFSVLTLTVLPALHSLASHKSANDAESVQRAIQLANEREIIGGSDSIRLSSSGVRRSTHLIHDFVRQYTERSLASAWKNQADHVAQAILDASVRHGFDPILLLAVIQNESRFDPSVVGTHGEIGLMQIKPDTAEWVAKKSHIRWRGADSLRDPAVNVRIGSAYLSMLRAKFAYDKDLYLGAYNMGVRNTYRLLSAKARPQVYPQRTIQHYSRIYLEFLDSQGPGKKQDALAAI